MQLALHSQLHRVRAGCAATTAGPRAADGAGSRAASAFSQNGGNRPPHSFPQVLFLSRSPVLVSFTFTMHIRSLLTTTSFGNISFAHMLSSGTNTHPCQSLWVTLRQSEYSPSSSRTHGLIPRVKLTSDCNHIVGHSKSCQYGP